MTTFTIDTDNKITAFAERPADGNPAETFSTEKEFAKLTAEWPASRLVDTWNGFAGAAPFDDLTRLKKFTDRHAALGRIWKAIQRLSGDSAAQAAPGATKKGRSKKSPSKGKRRAVAREGATGARPGSKKADVLELLRRKQGASLAEIMKATGWQAHTVRGFVSGTLTKKLGLSVESFRNDEKERSYRVTA